MAKIFVHTFETAIGATATQITKTRFNRMAGRVNQSMLTHDGYEFWYSWNRNASEGRAREAVREYAEDWLANGKPSCTDLRRAVEEGNSGFLLKYGQGVRRGVRKGQNHDDDIPFPR